MYNPKLARFFSVDPIAKKYPELTPYQFASNRPIDGIDLDGLEFLKSSARSLYILVQYRVDNKYTMDYIYVRNSDVHQVAVDNPANAHVGEIGGAEEDVDYTQMTNKPKASPKSKSAQKRLAQETKVLKLNARTNIGGAIPGWIDGAQTAWYNHTNEAELNYSYASAKALQNAESTVRKAYAGLPKGLQNPKVLADLTNYLIDHTEPPNTGQLIYDLQYTNVIKAWGEVLWKYKDKLQQGKVNFDKQASVAVNSSAMDGVQIKLNKMIGNADPQIVKANQILDNFEFNEPKTEVKPGPDVKPGP